jgi:hypothetical protein
MTEIKSLLEKAGSLAREAGPADAWPRMREWAEKEHHPFALKAAVFRFMEIHGTKPEAASVIPQVLHAASAMHFDKVERKTILDLSERSFRALELNLRKDHMLPVSNERPAPALFLNPYAEKRPDIYAPVKMSRDINQMITARDTIFNINQSLARKVRADGK